MSIAKYFSTRYAVFGLGVFFCLSCLKVPVDEPIVEEEKPLFVIEAEHNPEGIGQDIPLMVYPDSSAIALVPLAAYNAGHAYVLTLNIPQGAQAFIGDAEQVSGV